MKPMVKTNFSISQDDVTIHNSSLEFVLDFYHPLSSTCHDCLYHDEPDQSTPPVSFPHSLNLRVVGSNCNQIQGSHITQVEEKEGEDAFNLSSIFQNHPCEDDVLPLLDDFQSPNLGSESNANNSFNQFITLGDNHYDGDNYFLCVNKTIYYITK